MAAKTVLKRQEAAAEAPEQQRLRAVAGYFADRETGETDRLIYERVRLGIMSALSVNPSMSFAELKEQLQTSDANLSIHARQLDDAGYVTCKKKCAAPAPKNDFSSTAK